MCGCIECDDCPVILASYFLSSGLTVRGIIKTWEAELNDEISLFESQAKRVSQWDNQLRENEKVLVGYLRYDQPWEGLMLIDVFRA